MINDVKKMFIYSIDKRKYLTEFIKDMLQNKIYCTQVINKVNKMSVHNVNKNTRKCLVMHVMNMLLRIMILAVQKIHLNEVHFSRNKIFQLRSTTLRRTNVETLFHKDCNVVKKQLNSVAETVDCKQLISHAIVKVLIIHEIIYNFNNKFIIELIKILQ